MRYQKDDKVTFPGLAHLSGLVFTVLRTMENYVECQCDTNPHMVLVMHLTNLKLLKRG